MIIIIINDDVTLQELSSALSSSCLHQPAVSVNLIITTIIIITMVVIIIITIITMVVDRQDGTVLTGKLLTYLCSGK